MPEPHERLEEAMKARRLDLRMNWRELATAAHISYEALRSIRRGDYRPSDITARDLDDALKWQHGSVLGLLDNAAQPVPIAEPAAEREPTVAELRAEIEAERARREELERRIVEIERRERERIQEQTLDESA